MKKLRSEGKLLSEIAVLAGVSGATVRTDLGDYGHTVFKPRKCRLLECGVVFQPTNNKQLCCCRRHLKKYYYRRDRQVPVYESVCALPECSKPVLVRGRYGKFCGRSHYDRHTKRVSERFYERLFCVGGRCCFVCGEWLIVDEHHTEFTHRTGSNKKSRTVWLCPNHHRAIHWGLAIIEDGKYRSLAEEIRQGFASKHPELVRNWADKA